LPAIGIHPDDTHPAPIDNASRPRCVGHPSGTLLFSMHDTLASFVLFPSHGKYTGGGMLPEAAADSNGRIMDVGQVDTAPE